jgi:PAS domain S-box-containing protein
MVGTLRGRILFSFGGLILLLTLTLGGAGVLVMYRELWQAQRARLEDGADRAAHEVLSALESHRSLLQRIAGGREVEDFPKYYRVLALTRYLAGFKNQFAWLSYVNAEGFEEALTGLRRKGDEPADFGNDPLFLRARQSPGKVITGPVQASQILGQPVVRLALGIQQYFGDTFVGALIGAVPLSQITRSIAPSRLGEGGRVLLLDAKGRLLYGPRDRLLETLRVSSRDPDIRDALQTGEPGFGRGTLLGEDFLIATAPLTGAGWTAVTVLPYSEFIAGPWHLVEISLVTLVLVCIGGGLFSYLLATRMTSSLTRLAAAVRRFGQGERDLDLEITGHDEVALVARTFEQMTKDLSVTTVSRDHLDNILASMNDALFVVDPDGKVLTANPAACTLLGYGVEELEDQSVGKVFVAEKEGSAAWFAQLVTNCGVPTETEWRSADGRNIPVSLSSAPLFGSSGGIEGVICVAQDVTERLATEEKLRNAKQFLETVLNSMTEAITIVDAESLCIVGANRALLELAGKKERDVLGKSCRELTDRPGSPCLDPEEQCPLPETIASGAVACAERLYQGAEGRPVWVEVTTAPIIGSNGRVEHVVHIARDITERKKTEEELRRFTEKLAQSNRDLEEFAYVASHDLQEPLRKVIAFGDRLEDKYGTQLGDQGRDYLDRMKGASRRMQTLITDLLTFSRVTSRAQPAVPTDLGMVVKDVLGDLELRLEETGAEVTVGELPTVEADPLQMRQLFQNLIGNALKFRRQDVPPRVRVQAEAVTGPERENVWRLSVADNGIGFDPEQQERIFGVFQRLHGRQSYEGSGIGLALCRKIAQRHGGTLTASGRPGEGAIFEIVLPAGRTMYEDGKAEVFPGK